MLVATTIRVLRRRLPVSYLWRVSMPYKPQFTLLLALYPPPSSGSEDPLWENEPCAAWFSGGRVRARPVATEPVVTWQVACASAKLFEPLGWSAVPPLFSYRDSSMFRIRFPGGLFVADVRPVFSGLMWAGVPEEHARFDCTPDRDASLADLPPVEGPIGPSGFPLTGGMTATFDIYRPASSAVPTTVAIPGTIWHDPYAARLVNAAAGAFWTHIVECSDSVDIRDAVTKPVNNNFLLWNDGDMIRFPTGVATTIYFVVRVTRFRKPTGVVVKRVLLIRNTAGWPSP